MSRVETYPLGTIAKRLISHVSGLKANPMLQSAL